MCGNEVMYLQMRCKTFLIFQKSLNIIEEPQMSIFCCRFGSEEHTSILLWLIL